ncbi:GNAT family N-acetyltransferase [Pseudooceanicola sp.]|uniref:GNAT family N-acetyltransferase n=1 Tax=Pseudooceanicola sp. TaxID=1914328 RepID=UPI0026145E7A|nr:GNAT family N-acetyltransferase [Pseudooceanicola sp.]MDF1854926.1 GNAT family N-acetyltransferase [Pseudooceanicola sp.]
MMHVRKSGPFDAAPIARLLNEIIAIGGTTAMTRPVDGETIARWMASDPRNLWHLAEDESGLLLGVQWVEPHPDLGASVAKIATFARVGRTGIGIGSALFERTSRAVKALGYDWISAEIRADNAGGLTYYQSHGFEDYARKSGQELHDGQVVDKVLKRYNL